MVTSAPVHITRTGMKKLCEERDRLVNVERQALAARLYEAAEDGDLLKNDECLMAKADGRLIGEVSRPNQISQRWRIEMVTVKKTVTVSCLDCEKSFYLDYQPVEGQIINCPHCRAELEVINAHPLELDFYFDDLDTDEEWEPYSDSDDDSLWDDEED